ncbi:TPA: hypothetical protein ACOEGA_000569 [Enterobacter asburiae]|uniref:tail fiber/spike domain-containing protein n=1 Tax=Enterobacter asburiae TaxID=61645 RepID=UPI003B5E800A
MATQPTNLPVPSESPRDLKFNAGKIDEFATSMGWTYTDRFGNQHYTIDGMRWLAQQAISAFGYITMDSFEDGNTLTLPNQVLRLEATGEYYRWDGPFPKDVPENSTPDTTGGIGAGKWLSVGDTTLRPLVEVTANVIGTNNYSNFPGIGGALASGSDYLYNGVLYTTVGESGVIQSVSGNVVTTENGTAYLLDKRWPITDLRAWGVSDGDNADEAFANAATFLCRQDGTVRSLYVPPIGIKLSSVELRDMSNFNIHFDGTYVLGVASTSKNAMISVVNAVFFSITGNPIIESIANNYTYGIELKGGLPSLIAPLTGLLSNVCTDTIRFRRFPCAFRVGDGSDLQISEIQLNAQTNRCNCSCEVNGSQAIVSINGSLLCEPQQDFSYPKVLFNAIGGIIYQSSGETVASVDNDSVIAQIKQVSSSLYGNPFGSVKISCTHVECAGLLMAVDNNSGIVGDSDSKYSSVSFSNCQGSMLNGAGELIAIRVDPYEGTFSADETCNFYTSATRTARIVYSISSKFNFDVSPRSFRKGFNTLSSEIGSGNVNWIHNVQPIIKMSVNPVTIASSGTAPLGFSSREATGDYTFYFGDTTSGGIVLLHNLNMLNISISVPATGVLAIIVKLNGSEVFGCTNSGYLTLTKEMIPIGTVIEFEAKNGTGGSITTNAAARVIASASNIR